MPVFPPPFRAIFKESSSSLQLLTMKNRKMKWWPFNGCHWLGGERDMEIYILMNSSGNVLLKIKAAEIIKGHIPWW